MANAVRTLACLLLTTAALAACGSKPAEAPAVAAAPGGGATTSASAGRSGSAGDFHGVPVYPGATELHTHDTPASAEGTLHAGDYSSSDSSEQIRAYYREQLAKTFGAGVTSADQQLGEGMYKITSGAAEKVVTVLVHPGDSGGQIIGIQVISKD